MRAKTSKRYSLEGLVTGLREARLSKGLSQRALSQRAGLPQSQISRVERGEVDLQLSTLIELARALDLDVQLVPVRALSAVAAVIAGEGPKPAYSLDEEVDA